MTLKDIVELVVAPVHTPETIAYLDFKISEHRDRFLAVFPEETLTPKHHFLEHRLTLIEDDGPLVGVWKRNTVFFKQVMRHTNNFRNILLTLSTRHQMMMAYHRQTDCGKQALCVSEVPLNVLHPDIQETLRDTSPLASTVLLAKTVTCYGTRYNVGMILSFGSTGGLPDFTEIIQIAILDNCVHFIIKLLAAWYEEHLRSFQLEDTGKMALWEQQKLGDVYPLGCIQCGKKTLGYTQTSHLLFGLGK